MVQINGFTRVTDCITKNTYKLEKIVLTIFPIDKLHKNHVLHHPVDDQNLKLKIQSTYEEQKG